MTLKKAISVKQLTRMKFDLMEFEGRIKESLGCPERSGSWIIWGQSSNGKTRFSMQLAKALTKFGKVAYNTLEEGARKSFQQAVEENQMIECGSNFVIIDGDKYDELVLRLQKRKSPNIIIIDSIQYSGLTQITYKKLKALFPKKLFIFTSHAQGKKPKGRLADSVRYDADLKIFVEGFKAFPGGRLNGGGKPYVIWEKGSAEYWNKINL